MSPIGEDLVMASMNRRNVYSQQNLFQCLYRSLTPALIQTWKMIVTVFSTSTLLCTFKHTHTVLSVQPLTSSFPTRKHHSQNNRDMGSDVSNLSTGEHILGTYTRMLGLEWALWTAAASDCVSFRWEVWQSLTQRPRTFVASFSPLISCHVFTVNCLLKA